MIFRDGIGTDRWKQNQLRENGPGLHGEWLRKRFSIENDESAIFQSNETMEQYVIAFFRFFPVPFLPFLDGRMMDILELELLSGNCWKIVVGFLYGFRLFVGFLWFMGIRIFTFFLVHHLNSRHFEEVNINLIELSRLFRGTTSESCSYAFFQIL